MSTINPLIKLRVLEKIGKAFNDSLLAVFEREGNLLSLNSVGSSITVNIFGYTILATPRVVKNQLEDFIIEYRFLANFDSNSVEIFRFYFNKRSELGIDANFDSLLLIPDLDDDININNAHAINDGILNGLLTSKISEPYEVPVLGYLI